ncbi:cytochrome c [Tenacibaculum tangerinum]|uniref:Cytochrome c n=1 Tax=Tenacibaculum tangerinum TaxID=3038772 RepID=A0ABY8L3T8_9FLAO|nr:cytochrome c [Tenacibaculum tangerinum]WGH74863.1 cytochrome c [Tenacibaculum tangerinum]
MKYTHQLLLLLFSFLLFSCGNDKKNNQVDYSSKKAPEKTEVQKEVPKEEPAVSTTTANIDLSNKGIGPVKSVEIPSTIDPKMVEDGKELFKNKCSACHRSNKKFIGPNPTGILDRRSPEWIMNMIMNPEEMTKKDPIAKALLIEYNGSPMANQNINEQEARAILEYFRTLK